MNKDCEIFCQFRIPQQKKDEIITINYGCNCKDHYVVLIKEYYEFGKCVFAEKLGSPFWISSCDGVSCKDKGKGGFLLE